MCFKDWGVPEPHVGDTLQIGASSDDPMLAHGGISLKCSQMLNDPHHCLDLLWPVLWGHVIGREAEVSQAQSGLLRVKSKAAEPWNSCI